MSDDGSEVDKDGEKVGPRNPVSVTRYPTVTDNLDTVFELLSDARRRYLLYYLYTINEDVAEFEAAVDGVYEYEAAGTDTGDHATRENIKIELHHNHLPRLANAGVVDYDRRHGTIRFTGNPALEEWVEHAHYKELG